MRGLCNTAISSAGVSPTKIKVQRKDLDIVYPDFAKAFDLVPRHRLLAKLRAHKVDNELQMWLSTGLALEQEAESRGQWSVQNGLMYS